jgi:hypothetical protein
LERDKPETEQQPQRQGFLRGLLRLIVQADSSRRVTGRVKAVAILVGLIAAFAALGYGVPAVLSQYL